MLEANRLAASVCSSIVPESQLTRGSEPSVKRLMPLTWESTVMPVFHACCHGRRRTTCCCLLQARLLHSTVCCPGQAARLHSQTLGLRLLGCSCKVAELSMLMSRHTGASAHCAAVQTRITGRPAGKAHCSTAGFELQLSSSAIVAGCSQAMKAGAAARPSVISVTASSGVHMATLPSAPQQPDQEQELDVQGLIAGEPSAQCMTGSGLLHDRGHCAYTV